MVETWEHLLNVPVVAPVRRIPIEALEVETRIAEGEQQTTSRFPFRWCGMDTALSGISQLDAPPGLHSAQEEALDASESRYANPRGYADPIQSTYVRTGVNKIGSVPFSMKGGCGIL